MTRVQHALTLHTPLDLAAFRALGFGEILRGLLAQDATGAVGLAILFPTRDLWTLEDRQAVSQRLTGLLAELDVHGSLTGLYTISAASAARIGADFRRITLLAAAWIVVLVALQFRHFPSICLALLPVGCGTLWTAGLFALWGLKLNFMNIAILPMLLGLGIDFGIYMVHRVHRQGRQHVVEAVQLTGVAIGLSAFATQLAFGTLALSRNQGLALTMAAAFPVEHYHTFAVPSRYTALLALRSYPTFTAPPRVPSAFCSLYSTSILAKLSETWSMGSMALLREPPV